LTRENPDTRTTGEGLTPEGLTNPALRLIKYSGKSRLADLQEGKEGLVTEEAQLSHRIEETPEVLVLCLKGEIDCTHSNELSELLSDLRQSAPKNLVVDLSEVEYIDSSGLGVLVSERMRWVKQGQHFRLCHPNSAVQTVLQTSHLDHFFEIYPTREAALEG